MARRTPDVELPSTLLRSPSKAKRTSVKTLSSAEATVPANVRAWLEALVLGEPVAAH